MHWVGEVATCVILKFFGGEREEPEVSVKSECDAKLSKS